MLRTLDLFAGIGMFSEGLHRAGGFETVACCEIDDRKRVLLADMVPGVPLYGDIRGLTGDQVEAECGAIDVVAGSPPCKDFSSANTAAAGLDGEHGVLFLEAVRLVRELRPRWFVFENGPRLRTNGGDRIIAGLEAADYACWPLVVGPGHLGAPHLRNRVWIVGHAAQPDREGELRLPVNGEMAGLAGGPDAADAACGNGSARAPRKVSNGATRPARPGLALGVEDAPDSHGSGHQHARRRRLRRAGAPAAAVPADMSRIGCDGRTATEASGRSRRELDDAAEDDAPDAGGAGLAFWQGLAGDHGAQLAALERDVGPAVHLWAGGLGRHIRMADGLPDKAARFVMSACGDAVVVAVVEAVGRAVLATDAHLAPPLRPAARTSGLPGPGLDPVPPPLRRARASQ